MKLRLAAFAHGVELSDSDLDELSDEDELMLNILIGAGMPL